MRRNMTTGIVAVAAAIALAGCADPSATIHAVHLDHEPGQDYAVELGVGQRLVLLDEEFNASIGDGWRIAGVPDGAVLELVGEGFEPDRPDAVGGGGTYSIAYTAVGSGTTDVTLEYSYRGEERFEAVVRVAVD